MMSKMLLSVVLYSISISLAKGIDLQSTKPVFQRLQVIGLNKPS